MARATLNVAIFFAALIAVCTLVGALLPFPKVDGIYQKWAHFREHKDQYDVLFLGSSRFYRHIIPKQFDEQVRADAGRQVRSFNFGYDGMWPPESCFVLRELLSLKPHRMRWVFIEVMEISTRLEDPNLASHRVAYWHDLQHTFLTFCAISARPDSIGEKSRLYLGHAALSLRESTNQGKGANRLHRAFEVERESLERWSRGEWKDAEGYAGRDKPFEGAEREQYQQFIAKSKVSAPPLVPISDALRTALERMSKDVRAAGAEPILVISPSLLPRENYAHLPDCAPVWNFRGPQKFPELYEPGHHFDAGHLNREGAREFTKLLASQFATYIADEK